MTRPDHAHYIHAVARTLDQAGFWIKSVGGHDWTPRGGHILLGCQDGWDDYRHDTADVRWDEEDGWRILWGGLTYDLGIPMLAPPWQVAVAVGEHVGQSAHVTGHEGVYPSPTAAPGTAEFDAALAAYVPEDAR